MKRALQVFKENEMKEKAKFVVKYQNFKTDIAMKRKGDIKIGRAIFDAAVTYLKRGKKTAPLSNIMKNAIDQCIKECIQPLRPSKQEEKIFKLPIYEQKNAILPINNISIVKRKLTSSFDYGVMVDNNIKILESEKEARIFLEGIKFVNKIAYLVEIEKNIIK